MTYSASAASASSPYYLPSTSRTNFARDFAEDLRVLPYKKSRGGLDGIQYNEACNALFQNWKAKIERVDPSIFDHLDQATARQFAALLGEYAIHNYGNNQLAILPGDQGIKSEFMRPLSILLLAFNLNKFGLGLSDNHVNLKNLTDLNAPYKESTLQDELDRLFLDNLNLDSEMWTIQASDLTTNELLNLVKPMRYTNGAIRFLTQKGAFNADDQMNLMAIILIETAEKILLNKMTSNDPLLKAEYAQLIYNDLIEATFNQLRLALDQNDPANVHRLNSKINDYVNLASRLENESGGNGATLKERSVTKISGFLMFGLGLSQKMKYQQIMQNLPLQTPASAASPISQAPLLIAAESSDKPAHVVLKLRETTDVKVQNAPSVLSEIKNHLDHGELKLATDKAIDAAASDKLNPAEISEIFTLIKNAKEILNDS